MSGRQPIQEYAPDRLGRRRPVHTPRLGDRCRCKPCWAELYWTPERRAARAAAIRLQYADGRRQRHHDLNEKRAEHWRPEEDALVRELAGTHDALTIGRMLGERLNKPRSEAAVKHRVKRLGIFLMDIRPFTSSEVGRIFGVTRETVRVRFVATGLLTGSLRRGGPHGMRMFTRPELERLIREHPEAYEVEAILDPQLKALAQATTRGRRPLPTSEVERLTGVDYRELARWYAAGLVQSARRVEGVRRGRYGTWLIDAGDIATVRQLKAEHDAHRLRRVQACPAGHLRTSENTLIEPSTGQRRCRLCRVARRSPEQRAS